MSKKVPITLEQKISLNLCESNLKSLERSVMFGDQHEEELIDLIMQAEKAIKALKDYDPSIMY